MSHQPVALTYSARRALLMYVVPRYQEVSTAQKSLLLDTFVDLTGYARKSAIRLLNHPPANQDHI